MGRMGMGETVGEGFTEGSRFNHEIFLTTESGFPPYG
jgi:hypothetical protein